MNLFKSLGDPLNMMGGGLLWKPMKKATGLTDAQMIGIGAMAVGAPYALPMMGSAGAAGAGQAAASAGTAGQAAASQGGLLSTMGQFAGPTSQALNIANQTRALSQGQPMQAPPAQFQQGQGFAGLLNPTDQVDPEKRRQAQQMAVQGLLSGYGGRYG